MPQKFLIVVLVLASATVQAAEPIKVTARRLGDLLVEQQHRAPAAVISANRASITAEVVATIEAVLVDVGDEVEEGRLLLRLNNDNARLTLAQARAGLVAIDAQIVEAESRVKKAEELLGKSFISDEELIARRSSLAVLQANRDAQLVAIRRAELDVGRTRISAPFNAAVVERQAQVGSYAQPGTPLLTLVQTDQREVEVELDPRWVENLGRTGELQFESQGKSWPVSLERISSIIDPATRLVRGRFSFTDSVAPIGATGHLVWKDASGLLPVELIVQRGREFGVFTANPDVANFVAIPSAQLGRPAVVNLPPETLIIVEGHTRLQDGDSLAVTRR